VVLVLSLGDFVNMFRKVPRKLPLFFSSFGFSMEVEEDEDGVEEEGFDFSDFFG
jgi:hypothetical protein